MDFFKDDSVSSQDLNIDVNSVNQTPIERGIKRPVKRPSNIQNVRQAMQRKGLKPPSINYVAPRFKYIKPNNLFLSKKRLLAKKEKIVKEQDLGQQVKEILLEDSDWSERCLDTKALKRFSKNYAKFVKATVDYSNNYERLNEIEDGINRFYEKEIEELNEKIVRCKDEIVIQVKQADELKKGVDSRAIKLSDARTKIEKIQQKINKKEIEINSALSDVRADKQKTPDDVYWEKVDSKIDGRVRSRLPFGKRDNFINLIDSYTDGKDFAKKLTLYAKSLRNEVKVFERDIKEIEIEMRAWESDIEEFNVKIKKYENNIENITAEIKALEVKITDVPNKKKILTCDYEAHHTTMYYVDCYLEGGFLRTLYKDRGDDEIGENRREMQYKANAAEAKIDEEDRLRWTRFKYKQEKLQDKGSQTRKESNFNARVFSYVNNWSNKFFRPFVVSPSTQNALQSIPVYVIKNGQNKVITSCTGYRKPLFSSIPYLISSSWLLLRDLFNVSYYDKVFSESDLGFFFMRYSDAEDFLKSILASEEEDMNSVGAAIHSVSLYSVCSLIQEYHPNTEFRIIPDFEEINSSVLLQRNPNIVFDTNMVDLHSLSWDDCFITGVPLYIVQTLEKPNKIFSPLAFYLLDLTYSVPKLRNEGGVEEYIRIWDESTRVKKHVFFTAEEALNFCMKNGQTVQYITGKSFSCIFPKYGRVFVTNLESFLTLSQISATDGLDDLNLGFLNTVEEDRLKAEVEAIAKTADETRTKNQNITTGNVDKWGKFLATEKAPKMSDMLGSDVHGELFEENLGIFESNQKEYDSENKKHSTNSKNAADNKSRPVKAALNARKAFEEKYKGSKKTDDKKKQVIVNKINRSEPFPLDEYEFFSKLVNEDLIKGRKKRIKLGERQKQKLRRQLYKLRNELDSDLRNLIVERVVRLNKNDIKFVPSPRSKSVKAKPLLNPTPSKMARGIKVRIKIFKSILLNLWNET